MNYEKRLRIEGNENGTKKIKYQLKSKFKEMFTNIAHELPLIT